METKFGFTKMSGIEFPDFLSSLKIARTVLTIQQHHTFNPSYAHFKGNNHFEIQKGMKVSHVNTNGWADIGQHLSIYPDGSVVTGRSFELSPAGIAYNNANSFCIENVGNFDFGADTMTVNQRDAIVVVTAALCEKFNLEPSVNSIVYHHWFNLSNGTRNNGSGNNKTCPGQTFFGGNKTVDCESNFIPLVKEKLNYSLPNSPIQPLKYVVVNASSLNVRMGPSTSYSKAAGCEATQFGAVLRVFEEKKGWYRISNSAQHWVSANYTKPVRRALVNTDSLNIRSGPGMEYNKIGNALKNNEVFVYQISNGWSRISVESKWVKDDLLRY